MKRLIAILAGLLVSVGVVCADSSDMIQFTGITIYGTNTTTTTTATPDTDKFYKGYIESVILDITGTGVDTSHTNTLALVTLAGQGTGSARTALTLTNKSADGTYPVRDLVSGQSGTDVTTLPVRFPLIQDKLRLTVTSNRGASNMTATVYVILTDQP